VLKVALRLVLIVAIATTDAPQSARRASVFDRGDTVVLTDHQENAAFAAFGSPNNSGKRVPGPYRRFLEYPTEIRITEIAGPLRFFGGPMQQPAGASTLRAEILLTSGR